MRKIDESLSVTKRRGIRLKVWVDRYLKIQDTQLENGDIATTTHKEKTQVAIYLVSRLGNHPLKEPEIEDSALILDEWLDKGMTSTARVNRGLWVDIYKEAQHAGKVPPGWNPPEATRKPIPKVTRARLTMEDWQKIYNVAPEKHSIRNAMLLTIVTGQRRDDICHMCFLDMWSEHLHITQGKTGMHLVLPLTLCYDAIGITLKEVIDGCRDRILSPYLTHSRCQKQPKSMSKDNLSDYFAKARDLAGIILPAGKTPPTSHEQHSLSERLYRAQGIDTKTLLGHKVQATADRYNDTQGQEWVKLVI